MALAKSCECFHMVVSPLQWAIIFQLARAVCVVSDQTKGFRAKTPGGASYLEPYPSKL